MSTDGLKYWLALTLTPGLERLAVVEFLRAGGGARELFSSPGGPGGHGGPGGPLSGKTLVALKAFEDWERVERDLDVIEGLGVEIITFHDRRYPSLLKEIHDPPYMLYARGDTGLLGLTETVAVVGTRRPTHYGLTMAETISRDLAGMGIVVVSGMARGCDGAAHAGALASGGNTIAVLGTGIDVPYPKENRKLYERIAESGLLLSELPPGTPPAPYNFPKRNRIISGLSRGVVVVEAPLRSGALMTASLALEHNREVFAVPGLATNHKSRGTNRLIKDGAAIVEDAVDIVSALGFKPRVVERAAADKPGAPGLGDDESLVLGALEAVDAGPVHIDAIAEKTGFSASRVSALLLQMELKGLVVQRPGKCFVKRV
ncbi:MAG TPA: DNA-processing protein DprA [Thermodesulfobacteriota bacterium]|nr:DNA-processing protein DprA [Thermodesulfobacteriota bacterium]